MNAGMKTRNHRQSLLKKLIFTQIHVCANPEALLPFCPSGRLFWRTQQLYLQWYTSIGSRRSTALVVAGRDLINGQQLSVAQFQKACHLFPQSVETMATGHQCILFLLLWSASLSRSQDGRYIRVSERTEVSNDARTGGLATWVYTQPFRVLDSD